MLFWKGLSNFQSVLFLILLNKLPALVSLHTIRIHETRLKCEKNLTTARTVQGIVLFPTVLSVYFQIVIISVICSFISPINKWKVHVIFQEGDRCQQKDVR